SATSFIVNDPESVRFTACSLNSVEYFPFLFTFTSFAE
ncbi:hypothetical protein LEP1GSC024_3653, partial [Leptospira noguchii str. 2001034031]